MAIGTAVKRMEHVSTKSPDLPPQAFIQDQDTFVDSTTGVLDLNRAKAASAPRMQQGPLAILIFIIVLFFYFLRIFVR